MDMKQEIFMRLVELHCDPHAMGWDFSDLYQLACDAEKFYQRKDQQEASEREAVKMEREGKLIEVMGWIKFLSRLRNIPFKERKWGCRKYEYDPIEIDATELGN